MSGSSGDAAPLKIGDILAAKKPTTRTVDIVLDPETGEVVTFTFRAIPRAEFRDLTLAHPATKEQRAEFRKAQEQAGIPGHRRSELPFNSDTYPPALIAACSLSPEMTEEEATELWNSDTFGQGELAAILDAAQQVNQQQKARPPDPEA